MIAIAGGKGGCGKTTTTLGLARALAERVPVRAIDLDRGMPDLHRLAGVDREPTLAEAVAGRECVACAANRTAAGIEVLSAPRATADVDVEAALSRAARPEGVTLLDCPAGAGPRAATPLRAADRVVLVTTDREESVEDAAKTARMARSLGAAVVGAVVTHAEDVPGQVADALETARVVPMPTVGEPLADPSVRRQYRQVAGWIAARTRRQVSGP